MYVITTYESSKELVDLRMDSSNLIERIRTRINFASSNGDEYKLSSGGDDELMDSSHQFNVHIEGKVSELHRAMINQAIVYTWNLTAYQTKNFVSYFLKGYQFTFVPRSQLLVDADGKLQTRIVYFIAAASGKLASHDDFELLPKVGWLQESFAKYELPYVVLDHDDNRLIGSQYTTATAAQHASIARDYDKLYYVDFDNYIDPLDEDDIGSTILGTFRRIYTGNHLKKKKVFLLTNKIINNLYHLFFFFRCAIDKSQVHDERETNRRVGQQCHASIVLSRRFQREYRRLIRIQSST